MKKIALYGTYSENMLACLDQKCPEGFSLFRVAADAPVAELADADYIVSRAGAVGEEAFAAAPRLRMVQKWGVGYDKIDVKAAGQRGIPVSICVGGNSMPVAELAVTLMLTVLRNVVPMDICMEAGKWERDRYFPGILRGGFGCEIIYYDVFRLPEEAERQMGVRYVSLDELMRQSDIVSVHVPLLETTAGMIDREKLALMKPTAIIINTSRGGVINEADLIEALRSGRILGAGLDTYSHEPLDTDSPLLRMEQVVTTPHCAGNTVDNDINMAEICMDCIKTYDATGDKTMRSIVNKEFLA